MADEQTKPGRRVPLQELGVSGLTQYGGRIEEEWYRRLQGTRGWKIYREMADNDALIGAILFAVEMLIRAVAWRVEPFDDSPDRVEEAEFVETLMDDMSHTWADLVAEALSMLVYGFSPHEIVYKRREGLEQADPTRRSRHDDGRIGWRKLAIRAQDTVERWEFDDDGGVKGLWQMPPTTGQTIYIPIEKLLIFKTTSRKSSPEGRSVLRNAFVTWYQKKRIEEFEAIGIERDLAGMPVFYLPPELLDASADSATKAVAAEYKKIVQNIRNDEQSGLILPAVYDENGNQLFKFELAGTGSRRLFDTSEIVARKDKQLAMTVLADFVLLGHEKAGSFALSDDKTTLFATAIGAWLNELASVLNRHALPRLYRLNGFDGRTLARFVPGDLEKEDVERFAQAITLLTGAGWLTPGAEEDEAHARELLGLPDVPMDRELLRELPVDPNAPEPGAPTDDEEEDNAN